MSYPTTLERNGGHIEATEDKKGICNMKAISGLEATKLGCCSGSQHTKSPVMLTQASYFILPSF